MAVGFIFVALSATCLGVMPSFQKQVLLDGLPMNSLMFYVNWIITLVCLVMALVKKRSFRALKIQIVQSLLMGVFGLLITALLLNNSYLYLPVGTAIMLNFLYPSIVCIVIGIVFKEGFSKYQIAAIVVSVIGMGFLTGAGGNMPIIGIVLAVASAFVYGGYLIANEKGPANELPIEVKLFYVSLPGTILYCFIAPMTGTLVAPPKSIDVAFIIAVGLFNAGGYFFMMYGISKLGAAIASFVSMLEPIVSVIFSTLWFHDPVTIGIVVGGGLVMASILLIAIDGAKKGNSA